MDHPSFRQLMNLFEDEPTQPQEHEKVFVYGSLKRGFGNHRIIAPARFLGAGQTPPRFDLLDLGGFPGAIAGKHSMTGEVYEVDQPTMAMLDRLESNGEMYQRKRIPILLNGRQIVAWLYLYLWDDGMDELIAPEGNRVTWSLNARRTVPDDDDDNDDEVADQPDMGNDGQNDDHYATPRRPVERL